MALIILAGGKSTRMGVRDKALLPLGGETMTGVIIKRLAPLFSKTIVVAKDAQPFIRYSVRVISDEYPGCGPISGIHAGLRASSDPYNLILACDLPLIKSELVKVLINHACKDLTIPIIGKYPEPLIAVYAKRIVPLLERSILAGDYKLTNLLTHLEVEYISESLLRKVDPELRSFLNVNSPADYEKVKMILQEEV